jgi:hypothetical protein
VFDAAMVLVAVVAVVDAASRRYGEPLSPHPAPFTLGLKIGLSILLILCPVAGLVDDARARKSVLIGDKLLLMVTFGVLSGTIVFLARRGHARGILVSGAWTLALLVGLPRLINASSDSGTRQVGLPRHPRPPTRPGRVWVPLFCNGVSAGVWMCVCSPHTPTHPRTSLAPCGPSTCPCRVGVIG